jgi:acetyl esterase/lipase
MSWVNPPPEGVTREDVACRGEASDVQFLVTQSANRVAGEKLPVVLWIHGGGMVLGNHKMSVSRLDEYAKDLGLCSVSPEYRLAPEHPAPAAVDDCLAAWRWILDNAEERGWDKKRLIIAGESAGGGIAASLVQRIHDDGGIQPILQFLVYPMLDDRTTLRTDNTGRTYYVWSRANNEFGWRSYLGSQPTQAVLDAAVPARRQHLSGLPAAWIGVGSNDLFHDEDVAYAKRLQEANVEIKLTVVNGAFHASEALFASEPRSVEFMKTQKDVLRRAIAR